MNKSESTRKFILQQANLYICIHVCVWREGMGWVGSDVGCGWGQGVYLNGRREFDHLVDLTGAVFLGYVHQGPIPTIRDV